MFVLLSELVRHNRRALAEALLLKTFAESVSLVFIQLELSHLDVEML